MYERHSCSSGSRAWGLVHEGHAARAQPVQDGRHVRNSIPHVMDSLAALLQKPAHRSVRAERGNQLDVGAPRPEQDFLDTLVRDDLAMDRLGSERDSILTHGGVEVRDGDAHVVDVEKDRIDRAAVHEPTVSFACALRPEQVEAG